jgi:site-specific DNA recombinase
VIRAAGYIRVSTEEQAREGFSLGNQRRAIEEIVEREGWELVEVYVDEGRSGRDNNRPEYRRLLDDAAAGKFDTLVLWRFDRLGRILEERVTAEAAFARAGVSIVSHTDAKIDEDDPTAPLLRGIRAGLAEMESRLIGIRTAAGMRAAAEAGRVNGGPRRFGFEPGDGSGTLTPRPAEVAVVQLMFEMARAGKPQHSIAAELNELGHRTATGKPWSQPKVREMLRNRIWIGELVNQAGTHPIMEPLIDPELWHAVQRTFSKAGEHRGRPSHRFLLASGLLRCGACGSAMRVRTEHEFNPDRKTYDHYSCSGRRSGATRCKQPAVKREFIDRAVLDYFTKVALNVDGTVAQIAGERNRRLAEVDAKLAQARKVAAGAERQVERVDAMMRDEGLTLDEWRRLVAVPQREGEAAQLAIADLTAEREQVESIDDVLDATSEFMERIAALRAAVAGEITSAESVRAMQVALRRVFDGFILHRADSPSAPRRVDSDLTLPLDRYVLDPQVAADAFWGTGPSGRPMLTPTALELEAVGGMNLSSR